MKYFSLLLIGGLVAAATSCQSDASASKDASTNGFSTSTQIQAAMTDSSNYTTIEWIGGTNQALGKIKEGQVVEVTWKFKNTGNKPLVIGEVSAGCGCTVAERPEAPIAPGAEGQIKASFNSKNQGPVVTKTVTVRANTSDSQAHLLTFSGEVVK